MLVAVAIKILGALLITAMLIIPAAAARAVAPGGGGRRQSAELALQFRTGAIE